jgi:hypothetical protein
MTMVSQVIADLQAQIDRYAGWPVLTVDVRIADLRALLAAYADATAAERARCAAACRAVAAQYHGPLALDAGGRRAALECAEACERGGAA